MPSQRIAVQCSRLTSVITLTIAHFAFAESLNPRHLALVPHITLILTTADGSRDVCFWHKVDMIAR
jgi:hypothetical protein